MKLLLTKLAFEPLMNQSLLLTLTTKCMMTNKWAQVSRMDLIQFGAQSFAEGLSIDVYYQIVTIASKAVTLAVMRAMQQTEAIRSTWSSGSLPNEPENLGPDENKPKTGGWEAFQYIYPHPHKLC
jgi:hypothetical protein